MSPRRGPTKIQRLVEEARAGPFKLRIPQFDDVVTIVPRKALSYREQRLKREQIALRMAATPLPGGVKDVQDFLAAYDDIQDGFVTLAMAARLAVKYYPPAERTARVLASVADVLNLGPAGLALAPLRKPAKPHLAAKYRNIPNTYRLRLKDTARTGKWNPRFTEWLQVAQTSSSIFSVGLTLGGIMALPPTAAALAVTGGELELNPFPYDESLMEEYLGPWQKSARLRQNPPLRVRVEQAKAAALNARNQEINQLLRLPELSDKDVKLLKTLNARGSEISPTELAAQLDLQGTLTMPTAFGIPDLAQHFAPGTTARLQQLLRDADVPGLITPATDAEAFARASTGLLTPEDIKAALGYTYLKTRELMQAATTVLNKWKRLFKSHQSLDAEEHLALLAALNLAWQIKQPWFTAFGFIADAAAADAAIDDVPEVLDALTSWTDELPTSDHRLVAQQLVASTGDLVMKSMADPRTPVEAPLTPLAGFAALMTEIGGVAKVRSELGGSTIDQDQLGRLVSRNLWQDCTHDERQAVLDLFSPGSPTAAPPEMIQSAALAETTTRA